MPSERTISELACQVTTGALTEFAKQAQLSRQAFSLVDADCEALDAAATTALATLQHFTAYFDDNLTTRMQVHLRSAVKLTHERREWQAIQTIINNDAYFANRETGWQAVSQHTEKRLQRYSKRFIKLHHRLVVERFSDQIDSLTTASRLRDVENNMGLPHYVTQSLIGQLQETVAASHIESPSMTLVYELESCLNQLHQMMTMYGEYFPPDDWQDLLIGLNELREYTSRVDDFTLVRSRCTKWLEKTREPEEISVLQELLDVCQHQGEAAFSQLAEYLSSPSIPNFETKFLAVLHQIHAGH